MEQLFFYRQGARQAGVGMMIGPPLLAAAIVVFAHFMPGGVVFEWCFGIFGSLLASVFFFYGLRRVIYGGEWGCFVDGENITWVYPKRTGSLELPSWLHWLNGKEIPQDCPKDNPYQDRQIPLADITKFVVQIKPGMSDREEGDYSYFIETASGSFEIDSNCFARTGKLARALLAGNPNIQLEFRRKGQAQPWSADHPPDGAAAVFGRLFNGNK